MSFNPENMLEKVRTLDGRKKLLSEAGTGDARLTNAMQVASQLYLAQSMFDAGRTANDGVTHSALGLVKALESHGRSLVKATEASDKNMASLTKVTWCLSFAVCGLLAVAGLQFWLLLWSGC